MKNVLQQNLQNVSLKFVKNVELRWKTCYRDKARFQTKNKTWLDSRITFFEENNVEECVADLKPGRPLKRFEDCGVRAKQKKVQNLVQSSNVEELSFATQLSLRKSGKRAAASILQDITNLNSAESTQKYRKLCESAETKKQKLTPEEALALIINTKSSKSTYLAYRATAKNCNTNIYPSWNSILTAKRNCYPNKESFEITDNQAEIKLEALLHLTAKRLCQLQEEVLNSFASNRLTLICKWGLDGSSGQSNYRQLTRENISDSSVFIILLVPLQLRDNKDDTKILWQNPVPSSTRFCRAIKFIFGKETTELTV